MTDIPCIAMSIIEAARYASIGRTKLYQAIAAGELPVRKLGRRSLVLTDDLRNWLTALPEIKRRAAP